MTDTIARIFVRFDSKEVAACHVLARSVIKHSLMPVMFSPIVLGHLGGLFTPERNALQSPEFSFSRFMVPDLNSYEGWSRFMDCDMLARADIGEAPSTGFALAASLCDLIPDRKIVLAGFSGERSDRLQIIHIHDWTFEQTVQRLLVRSGRLTIANAELPPSYAALLNRLLELAAADISLATAEILSEPPRSREHRNRQADLNDAGQPVHQELRRRPEVCRPQRAANRDCHPPDEGKAGKELTERRRAGSLVSQLDCAIWVAKPVEDVNCREVMPAT